LEALRALAGLEEAPDFIREVHAPDLRRHGPYRRAMGRQKVLYEKLVKEGL
jgi:hypothetical protein